MLEPRELLTVDMSPEDQLMIELVNRARADPLAEVARNPDVQELNEEVEEDEQISEDPKQPLAPHQSLIDAMATHTVDMLLRDFFGHDNPDGETPSDRARDAGYPTGAGENIAWSGNTGTINRVEEIYLRHAGLFDSVGHRKNMMRENWREIGAAVHYGEFTEAFVDYNSIMVGTLFGNRGGDHFITGVAISDHIIRNNFYEIGEGIGEVTITAVREGTTDTYTTTTGRSGGYSLQVPNGVYTVTATSPRLASDITVRAIEVEGQNVKVDFNNLGMPTRFIAGQFFEDTNNNGQFDEGEPGIEGRTAWIDLNTDGQLDANEPQAVSESDGTYRFEGLFPGEYTIEQVVPDRWAATLPSEGNLYIVPLEAQNLIGVDFGSRSLSSSWQNPAEPRDVNNDGAIVARDAILIIRELNIVGPRSLTGDRPAGASYLDVTGDNFVNARDALQIIRFLNARVASGEPPESPVNVNDAAFAYAVSQRSSASDYSVLGDEEWWN